VRAIEAIRKKTVTIAPDGTLAEAADLMDRANVGSLLVIDGERLAGIVTDRDIVLRGVANRMPADARIDSVMTTDVMTLDADADLRDVLPIFRTHACRRVPLTSDDQVVGVLTADDLLVDLIADLGDISRPIIGEVIFGHHDAKPPETFPRGI